MSNPKPTLTSPGIYLLFFMILLILGYYKINQLFGERFAELYVMIVVIVFIFGLTRFNPPSKPKIPQYERIQTDESRYIPPEVKLAVWIRDGGRCVLCGSKQHLEWDHDIPYSKGGSNTENNIRILCKKCNRRKHAKIE